MPEWDYSIIGLDLNRTAKASGRDIRMSPKAAREVCNTIRHMSVENARVFLQEVTQKRKAVPYRRHKKEVGHKAGIEGFYAGRYPTKVARAVLSILDTVEANAEFKGLDTEKLKIVHAAAQRARKIKRYIPRAFGRSSSSNDLLCHVEVVVEEVE